MNTLRRFSTAAAIKHFAMVAVVAAAGAVSASATTITQTFTVPGSGYNTTVWNTTYSVNKFDSTLGTLNSVTISLVNTVNGSVTVTNNTGQSGVYNAQIQAESWFSLDSALLAQNGNSFDPSASSISVFVDDANFRQGPNTTIASGASDTRVLNRVSTVYTNEDATGIVDQNSNIVFSGGLSYFTTVGTGTFNVYELVAGKTGFLGPAPADASGTPTSKSVLTFTYNYTAAPPPSETPEPVSMVLFGSGLLGVALLRKRATR